MKMKDEARNQMIDVLRGASAMAVALFHFNEPYPALHDAYHRILKWGWLGVPGFFVVSGFCIAAARQKVGLISFWFRRLMRIFPPYWASLILVLCVVGLRVATTGTNDVTKLPRDLGGWFYTAAALTSPASTVPGLNWVYWSLGYELAFYIVMGILAYRNSVIFLGLFSALAFFSPGYPFDQWGLFGLGVACYYYTKQQYRTALIIGAICLANIFVRQTLPVALTGCLTVLLVLFPPRLVLSSFFRPLRQVGPISYSLYLIHVPIGCYLLPDYLPWKLSRRFWPSLLQDLVFLLGCILFASLFYRLAERPSHELARRAKLGGFKGQAEKIEDGGESVLV